MSDFTLQPFPLTLTISDESTYNISRFHVKGMKALTKKINTFYATDPSKVAIKKAYDDMVTQRANYVEPVTQRIEQFTDEQSTYLTNKRFDEQQAIDDITLQLTTNKQEHATKIAIGLVRQGKIDDAQRLISMVNISAPKVEATKPADSTTRWGYDILDEGKLNKEFLKKPLPDRSRILATVTKHHAEAEQIVGRGAIKVTSTTRPIYRYK